MPAIKCVHKFETMNEKEVLNSRTEREGKESYKLTLADQAAPRYLPSLHLMQNKNATTSVLMCSTQQTIINVRFYCFTI